MRYMLAGGGTGGHIYPALTIARALQEVDPRAELLYVGTATGREAKIVPLEGIPFVSISSGGLINLSLAEKLKGGLKALKGLFEAIAHIRTFKPHVVIGTGGFVSGPVLLAAKLLGRPIVIQEQNAFPGVTNRIASRWARVVFVPYDEALPHFPASAHLSAVGNPVRREVTEATREEGRQAFGYGPDERVLLVMGGSGGARDFNQAVVAAILRLLAELPALRVLHVAGERYVEATRQAYGSAPGVTVVPYLHNMPEAYAAADAGVFRAGALTLAELQVRALPAVLVPSPNVTHNHQEWNARTLEKHGAALVVREGAGMEEQLTEALRSILTDLSQASAIGQALQRLAQPLAGRAIAEAIIGVAERR